MAAFVLGNGVSRLAVLPQELERHGPVFGCNALYRSYRPWVLVATDQHISREIQESGYPLKHRFYTRRPIAKYGAQKVPQEYFGFSSGPIAVALAAQDNHDPIYMLGFDMGPDQTGKFNNIFAGTEFYKPKGSTPTFTGNWIKQLCRIMKVHQKQTFVRVVGDTTAPIKELEEIKNCQHLAIAEFLARINNGKGF